MPSVFKQDDFSGGLDMFNDRSKLYGTGKYPLLINARSRHNGIRAINKPKVVTAGLPIGGQGQNFQGLYSAGNYGLVFVEGLLYLCDFNSSNTFYQHPSILMNAEAPQIYFQLVPASTINYQRRANDSEDVTQGVSYFNVLATPSPVGGVIQDGISQPWILLSNGQARVTKNYTQWTNSIDGREYVPIGKQMAYVDSKLYITDGKQIFQSVSGRPLDFMIIIDDEGNSLPLEADGGAFNNSHRVFFEDITAMHRVSTGEGSQGFYVGGLNNSVIVTPDFSQTAYNEPIKFNNTYVASTGARNQFCFLPDVNGDSSFVNVNGIRSFNSVLQFKNEGKNAPFSLMISSLFNKDILQNVACCGQFDNYSCYALNTTYGQVVMWFDELRNVWDAVDIWSQDEVNGIIRQFAEVVTSNGERRLFFLTTTGYVYEYFAGTTASAKLYVGDWCSSDPKVEQKMGIIKVVIDKPEEAGTLYATLFVDNQLQFSLNKEVEALYTPSGSSLAIPFGDASSDSLSNIPFQFLHAISGYKFGTLLEWNFKGNIINISATNVETLDQIVASVQQQAKDLNSSSTFLTNAVKQLAS